MNIQTLQQALEDIEKAWRLDYITSDVLPAIQAIRNEIAKHQKELLEAKHHVRPKPNNPRLPAHKPAYCGAVRST